MAKLYEDDKSPKWIWQPALVGAVGVFFVMALNWVPGITVAMVAWAIVVWTLTAMGVLARRWHARLPVTAHELEYVRLGILVLTLAGLGALGRGAIPLTLAAGPAFYIWTIVENRRSRDASS